MQRELESSEETPSVRWKRHGYPFRSDVDDPSSVKVRIQLLLEAGFKPGKPAPPARFSGRPLRGSTLTSDGTAFH